MHNVSASRLHTHAGLALLATLLLWGGSPAEAPVADAAMRGDVDEVRTLLRSGADVNAAQGDGMTALHWAAELDAADMAVTLLSAGANPAALTRLGDYTALHVAARASAEGVARALLEAGADPEARTSTGGATPLHFAAGAGDEAVVDVLIEHGADIETTEAMWFQTPLMFAAAGGHAPVVRALLQAGADPAVTARVMDMDEREQQDQVDRRRQEEIQSRIRAAQEGDPNATVRLPGSGPTVPGQGAAPAPSRDEVNAAQRDRRPSSRFSHAQLVGGYGGLAALHLAVREGHATAARELLSAGAHIDQPTAGDRTTPLLMATINGHFDLAMDLLGRGADPNLVAEDGSAALFTVLNRRWGPKAAYPQPSAFQQQHTDYLEILSALLEAGADVNHRTERHIWYTSFNFDQLGVSFSGATAFWRAAYATDLDAMHLLIEAGADPHLATRKVPSFRFGRRGGSEDKSGLPPLPTGAPAVFPIHAASGVGYGEGFAANSHSHAPDSWLATVRYLVEEHGADVNARDLNGYSPVHHAAARGDNELIEYLVSKGADVTLVSRRGETTVDMANGPRQRVQPFPETIALLESLGAVNNHNCQSC